MLQASFESLLETTGLQHDFDFLCVVKGNRVRGDQLKTVHKKSAIECVIEVATQDTALRYSKQAKTILDYMSLHPICESLLFCYSNNSDYESKNNCALHFYTQVCV